jgi:diaminopimelate epimerase
LCHRNFGIGGDGVIFALKAPQGELRHVSSVMMCLKLLISVDNQYC